MLLNGTSSVASTAGLGGITGDAASARTIAAIVRRNSTGGWDNVASILSSANANQLDLTFDNSNVLKMEGHGGGGGSSTGPTLSSGWYYVAGDTAGGTAAGRFHHQKYGTDTTVTHTAGTGNLTPAANAIAKVGLGAFNLNSDWFDGDEIAVAIWNRKLADWEHEYLAANLGAWQWLSPDWLVIELASVLPANIPDLSGKGAPLTTLTSLAVTTASVPVGFGAPIVDVAAAAGGLATVTADRDVTYDILNTLAVDRAVTYDILNALQVDRQLVYDILATVVADRALAYDVLNGVPVDRAVAYDIVNTLQVDRALAYDVGTVSVVERLLMMMGFGI